MFLKHNLRVMLLLASSLAILTACETPVPSVGTSGASATPEFCLVAKPILYDRLKDTADTLRQVEEYDAKGKELCGW